MSDRPPAPLMLRLISAAVTAAERAGNIIREVTRAGQLGVIDKVSSSCVCVCVCRARGFFEWVFNSIMTSQLYCRPAFVYGYIAVLLRRRR